MRTWLVLGAVSLAACGGGAGGGDGGGQGGQGGQGGGDGGGGAPGDGGGDVGPVEPAPSVCTAPEGAVDSSRGGTVVGTGSAGSCSEEALGAALAKGGVITFACGDGPATIKVSKTLQVPTSGETVLDGGGRVTLDGGGAVRILEMNGKDWRKSDARLVLQHITLSHGKARGTMPYKAAPAPCSQGFYDGYGGAVLVRDGRLLVVDATFADNEAETLGPDVGGGAIGLLGSKAALIVGARFINNRGSDGGALKVLNSELDLYNTVFQGNRATGHGANSNDMSKCAVKADNGQYQVGSGGNGGAMSIDGGQDGMHTLCGVRFIDNHAGDGALGGGMFRTPDAGKRPTVIDRCLFSRNEAGSVGGKGGGGAAYFHDSDLKVTASTFEGNVADGPGAIQCDGTVLDLVNCTFAGNNARAGLGGALAAFGGTGSIVNSTFAGNLAEGGDPYFGAVIGGNPTLTLRNCIFADNTALNPGAPMQCHVMGTGDGNVQWPRNHKVGGGPDKPCTPSTTFADAKLGALGDHGGPTPTLVPAGDGAAVGAGKDCPMTDQRGLPRAAGRCTAGAVEVTP